MFQIVLLVASIALASAIAVSAIFYGGEIFTNNTRRINIIEQVNDGQSGILQETVQTNVPENGQCVAEHPKTVIQTIPSNVPSNGYMTFGGMGLTLVLGFGLGIVAVRKQQKMENS